MDPWRMFCHLCKQVVENENVVLDIMMADGAIQFRLVPVGEEFGEDEDEQTGV